MIIYVAAATTDIAWVPPGRPTGRQQAAEGTDRQPQPPLHISRGARTTPPVVVAAVQADRHHENRQVRPLICLSLTSSGNGGGGSCSDGNIVLSMRRLMSSCGSVRLLHSFIRRIITLSRTGSTSGNNDNKRENSRVLVTTVATE